MKTGKVSPKKQDGEHEDEEKDPTKRPYFLKKMIRKKRRADATK